MKETWQTYFESFVLPQERSRRLVDELRIGFAENRWALTQGELQPDLEGALVLTENRLIIGFINHGARQVLHLNELTFMSECKWDKRRPERPYQVVLGSNHDVALVIQTAKPDAHESTMLSDLLNEAFVQLS